MSKLRLGILSSHNGSGFMAIQKAIEDKELNIEVVVVISNNSGANVLEFSKSKNIDNYVVNSKLFPNDDLDEKITNIFKEYKVDYIFLSGYMKKLEEKLLSTFKNKIVNSHPSLLPKFGGKGMYGTFVHEAVINSAEKVSGCTIHFVDEEYDKGEYILQNEITLDEGESVSSLEEKIKTLESKTIIEAFKKLTFN